MRQPSLVYSATTPARLSALYSFSQVAARAATPELSAAAAGTAASTVASIRTNPQQNIFFVCMFRPPQNAGGILEDCVGKGKRQGFRFSAIENDRSERWVEGHAACHQKGKSTDQAHHSGGTGSSLNTGAGPPRLERWIAPK